MAITRTHDIDDDGTGTTGTPRNAAWKEELYDQIDAAILTQAPSRPEVTQITADGNYHNLAIGGGPFQIVRCTGTGGINISGFQQTGGNVVGTIVYVYNLGPLVTLLNFTTAPPSTARLYNIWENSSWMAIGYRGLAVYTYEPSGYWVMLDFEQGDWISVPYSAANFSAGGSSTWTVTAGQVLDHRYMVQGKDADLLVTISLSTLTGSDSTVLNVGGWPATMNTQGLIAMSSVAVGGWGPLMGSANNNNVVSFNRTDFAAFPAGGVYLYFSGHVRFL